MWLDSLPGSYKAPFLPIIIQTHRPKIVAGRDCCGLSRLLSILQAKAGLCPTAV